MTDPWADVRERLEAEELRLTSEPIGDIGREFDNVRRNLTEVGRTVIDDADALLAVKYRGLLLLAQIRPDAGLFNKQVRRAIRDFDDALAALPGYLR